MGPVSPAASALTSVPPRSSPALDISPAAGGAAENLDRIGSGSLVGAGNSLPVNGIQGAVSQMLRSIGGGAENDKFLQMLIALLILMAMLEQTRNTMAGDAQQLLSPLASRGDGPGSMVVISSSSTTISIEQTSIYMVGTSDAAGPAMPEANQASAGRLDVSA